MTIINRAVSKLRAPEQRSRTMWGGGWAAYPRTDTSAKISVTHETAMRHSAVWACINLWSDLLATLPVAEYVDGPDGMPQKVDTSPLIRSPYPGMTWVDWLSVMVQAAEARGNAYGRIVSRDSLALPTAILPIHPDDVVPVVRSIYTGVEAYRVGGETVAKEDIVHFRQNQIPGSPLGLSPISYARQAIGLGLAVEQYGAEFFGDGAHPTALLTTEQKLTAEQGEEAKSRFEQSINGRGVAALGYGWDYKPLSITPDESQFLDTIQANVATVARFWRVPPEMIGGSSGESMTYANVEQRMLHLLVLSANPRVVRWEKFLSSLIRSRRYVKLNVDAIVRPDLSTRYRAHTAAIRDGWKSRNEIRALEQLPPIAGGDAYLWPPGRMQLTEEELAGNTLEGEP